MADLRLLFCHALFYENEHAVSDVLIFLLLHPLDYAIILMTLTRKGAFFTSSGQNGMLIAPDRPEKTEIIQVDPQPLPLHKPPMISPGINPCSGACLMYIINPCHSNSPFHGRINNTGLYALNRLGFVI